MFSGLNLQLIEEDFKDFCEGDFYKYMKTGESHLKSKIVKFKRDIKELISKETINGSLLQEYCFPGVEADIFLSHSHKDRDLANALAGWIHTCFGLNVFVDSNVWEYQDELLEELNSRYSNKRPNGSNGYLYNHASCCKVSEHVNTMLTAALHKMIDKVECVLLLNTDNSICVHDNEDIDSTYSPWIYSEIMCTQIVRKKSLICYRDYNELMHVDESTNMTGRDALVVSYNVSLQHLVLISISDLVEWYDNYSNSIIDNDYPLDCLYYSTHKSDVDNTKKLYRLINRDKIKKIQRYYEGEVEDLSDILDNIRRIHGSR